MIAAKRAMNACGASSTAVVPSRNGFFNAIRTRPSASAVKRSLERRAQDVAAQGLPAAFVAGMNVCCCVQREASVLGGEPPGASRGGGAATAGDQHYRGKLARGTRGRRARDR